MTHTFIYLFATYPKIASVGMEMVFISFIIIVFYQIFWEAICPLIIGLTLRCFLYVFGIFLQIGKKANF